VSCCVVTDKSRIASTIGIYQACFKFQLLLFFFDCCQCGIVRLKFENDEKTRKPLSLFASVQFQR